MVDQLTSEAAAARTARRSGQSRTRLARAEVFQASFGAQPFRYPPAVEILSSRLRRGDPALSRWFEVGGTLVATARRLMQGRGSE